MAINFTEAIALLTIAQDKVKEAQAAQRQSADLIDEARTSLQAVFSLGSIEGIQEILEAADSVESDCNFAMINKMKEIIEQIETVKGT